MFAKISKLAEEVKAEPKFEHKESLQVEPEIEELELKKHAVSEPARPVDNFIEPPKEKEPETVPVVVLGIMEPRPAPRRDTLNMSLFQLGKTVGSGKFGEVCQCRYWSVNAGI